MVHQHWWKIGPSCLYLPGRKQVSFITSLLMNAPPASFVSQCFHLICAHTHTLLQKRPLNQSLSVKEDFFGCEVFIEFLQKQLAFLIFIDNRSLQAVFFLALQIRLVVEEGLNQLPYTECTVTTPTGMWEITPLPSRTGGGSLINVTKHRTITEGLNNLTFS